MGIFRFIYGAFVQNFNPIRGHRGPKRGILAMEILEVCQQAHFQTLLLIEKQNF